MTIVFAAGLAGFLDGGLLVALFIGGFAVILIIVTIVVAIKQRGVKPVSGVDEMIGMEGYARTALHPTGALFIRSELWRAEAVGEAVEKGEKVVVRKIRGLTLIVEKAEKGGENHE